MKYRKKPIIIEAFRFGFDETPDWAKNLYLYDDKVTIPTLEGVMTATHGDFIIKGVLNELYPCKAEIFNSTYEKVL